jgi:hypothetical protein
MTYHSFFNLHSGHTLRFELSKSKKTFKLRCDTCDKLIWRGRVSAHPKISWLGYKGESCAGHAILCHVWECSHAGETHGGKVHECNQLALECNEPGCGKDEHDVMTNTFLAFFASPDCDFLQEEEADLVL